MPNFPSVLNTFNRPTPSDRLNSPSHSALHNTVSSALGQVEAVIGVDGENSVVGTMMYDLRSPASRGGGHVQGAAFGGTGQTTFVKGDILVAQSASVLGKTAIGSDGQILKANSATASGVNWVDDSLPKIFGSGSVITIPNNTETSIFSTTIPGSTLGTSNAVRATVFLRNWKPTAGDNMVAKINYAGGTIASVFFACANNGNSSVVGKFEHTIIGNNTLNSQRHTLIANLNGRLASRFDNIGFNTGGGPSSAIGIYGFYPNTSSVESTNAQAFGMTLTNLGTVSMEAAGVIVEKIT